MVEPPGVSVWFDGSTVMAKSALPNSESAPSSRSALPVLEIVEVRARLYPTWTWPYCRATGSTSMSGSGTGLPCRSTTTVGSSGSSEVTVTWPVSAVMSSGL